MRAIRVQTVLTVGLLVSTVGSCALQKNNASEKLRRQLAKVIQRAAENEQLLEDVNTRLTLIEDKLVASSGAWGVPRQSERPMSVVRINAGAHESSAQPSSANGSAGTSTDARLADVPKRRTSGVRVHARGRGESLVVNQDVEYSGQALARGPRPMLRLQGQGRSRSLPGPGGRQPPMVEERLPVVPVAPLPAQSRSGQSRSGQSRSGQSRSGQSRSGQSRSGRASSLPQPPARQRAPKAYAAALEDLRAGENKKAAKAFKHFIARNPKHPYVDNAMYWLGESLYDMKQYRRALKIFRRVVEEYPTGNKAADALLKMAYSYLQLQDKANARTVLAQVLEIFPQSRVAQLASKTLAELQ